MNEVDKEKVRGDQKRMTGGEMGDRERNIVIVIVQVRRLEQQPQVITTQARL